MAKPIPEVVPSDDCPVTVNGAVYYPHEGETVTLFRAMSVGEVKYVNLLRELGPKVAAVDGATAAGMEMIRLADEAFDQACTALARRIVDWDWTDDHGRPLPKPDGSPEPLRSLRPEELMWLLNTSQGETPSERKNG